MKNSDLNTQSAVSNVHVCIIMLLSTVVLASMLFLATVSTAMDEVKEPEKTEKLLVVVTAREGEHLVYSFRTKSPNMDYSKINKDVFQNVPGVGYAVVEKQELTIFHNRTFTRDQISTAIVFKIASLLGVREIKTLYYFDYTRDKLEKEIEKFLQ